MAEDFYPHYVIRLVIIKPDLMYYRNFSQQMLSLLRKADSLRYSFFEGAKALSNKKRKKS